jgi:hypothetical protein
VTEERAAPDEAPEPPRLDRVAVTWRAPVDHLHFEDAPAALLVLPNPEQAKAPLLLPFGSRDLVVPLVRAIMAWASRPEVGVMAVIREQIEAEKAVKVAKPIIGIDGRELRS